MAVHREYFAKLCRHPKIVGIIKQLLGEDLKLVQSMSLLKPPGEPYMDVLYKCILLELLIEM